MRIKKGNRGKVFIFIGRGYQNIKIPEKQSLRRFAPAPFTQSTSVTPIDPSTPKSGNATFMRFRFATKSARCGFGAIRI